VWFFPLPLGKKFPPACKDAQDEKNRLTPQQGLDRLNKGLNVGIYCLPGGLFIIDEDRENGAFVIPDEVRATFPKTLTIQTRNAGCQYYYKNNGTFNNKIYKFGGIKAGELRANWYYGVAPGSYVKPDDNAGQDATGLYSIINGVSVSPLEKIPAWMEVCEDIPKEKIKIEIENEITWKNDLGMPLYEIRKKSQKLDALLNGANEADRSAADMAAVQLLYFWRFTDSEISRILQEYRAYEKIARQDYIETTISKIIRGERYNPNYKSNGNGKEALENKTPAIEVDTVEDIPIPIEDKIPPISFDGLWEYSYHNFFKDYVASMSDGYPEYAFQNGTATLSTLSRRRLYIRLNGRTEYMNLITLSLGQSGYARKGSAFSAAQRFLRTAVGDTFLSPDLTPEGMISEIADTITTIKKTKSGLEEVKEEKQHGRIRKAVCAWWKDEAGQLYAQLTKPYMQSFKEQICNFYDSPELGW